MFRRSLLLLVLLMTAIVSGFGCTAGILSETERGDLSKFATTYFEAPAPLQLSAHDIHIRPWDCVYELTFRPTGELGKRVELVLLMTPDRRFLGRHLIDWTAKDAALARHNVESALASDVRRGSMPKSGPDAATRMLVVFSDFTCPHCKEMDSILKQLAAEGRVQIGFRFLPIISPHSRALAEIAACAYTQGNEQFWAANDALFEHQTDELIADSTHVETLLKDIPGVDLQDLHHCVATHAAASLIDRDLDIARRNGFSATPVILLDDQVLKGPSEAELRRIIVEGR